jgi:hypothetical protein
MTTQDLDTLRKLTMLKFKFSANLTVGGSRRPKSKAMIEKERHQQEQDRLIRMKRSTTATSKDDYYQEDRYEDNNPDKPKGAMASIQSTFDDMEHSAAGYMNSLGEMVKGAKDTAFKASLKNKFGL